VPQARVFGSATTCVAQQFGGMDVSDANRLKALEAESARLKKLLAESMLEIEVTREAVRKNGDRPSAS
jgi:hypothetical protein